MGTSLEQIQKKIAELEERLVNLKITERELLALEKTEARPIKALLPKPKMKPAQKAAKPTKTVTAEKAAADLEPAAAPQQTIAGTIREVLREHGTLSVKAIGSAIQASGKDINNRAISFALQALKKRGLAKSAGGEWSLKGRSKRAA